MIKTDKKTCVLRSKALGIRLMQDIWLGCLLAVSLWRCFRHFQLVGDPGADPEHAGGTTYLFWPGNTLGSTRRSWRTLLGWRMSGCPYSVWCNFDLVPDKTLSLGWEEQLQLTCSWLDSVSLKQYFHIFSGDWWIFCLTVKLSYFFLPFFSFLCLANSCVIF